jgi:HK97 family phage portal protein
VASNGFLINLIPNLFRSTSKQESTMLLNQEKRGKQMTLQDITSWDSFLYDGNNVNSSGESVTGSNSWRFSAVYRCITLISETIATLPFQLYEVKGNGNKFVAKNHPSYSIYSSEPNQFQTWFDLKMMLISQALTYGNGYCYIRRDKNGNIVGFEPLSNTDCVPYYIRTGTVHYLYYYVFGEMVEQRDIIHIKCIGSDGVIGRNPIEIAREAIGAGLAQQNFTGSMYKNGLNLQGTLEHPATLSSTAQERLRTQMNKFKGSANGNDTLILEEGLKYNSISLSPIDAQFIESKKFTIEEIARFYGVPLHKIGSLDKATNNNIEHQDLEFYKNCIASWEERFEQEFNRKILLPREKSNYKHQFDNSSLLRTDTKARMEWIQGLFNKGAVTPNEIRVMEGLNAIDNPKMDETYMQLAMSTVNNLETNNGSDAAVV